MTISVLGEALIDFIQSPDDSYQPYPGGSLFNVAIGLGLQGVATQYLSPLSKDNFGKLLEEKLLAANVRLPDVSRSHLPTSLAMVNVDESGNPVYVLYREGVADRDLNFDDLISCIPKDCKLLHSGSLAITPADIPLMKRLFGHVRSRGILVSIDINIRENVVADTQAYLQGIESLLPCCDLVKVSDEDLQWFNYSTDFLEAALVMQDKMAGNLLTLTLGSEGATILQGDNPISHSGFQLGKLEDAIGAGDTFFSALLASLEKRKVLERGKIESVSENELARCLEYACCAAAINVTRKGCQPPSFDEVNEALSTR